MIQGEKVYLLAFEPDMGSWIEKWHSSPAYKYYFRNMPEILTREQYSMFPKLMNMNILMIVDKINGNIVGMCTWDNIRFLARTCEIGFLVDEDYQGAGFTKDAFMTFADYLFNRLGFHKISAKVAFDEVDTLCKTMWGGMHKEAILEQEFYLDGEYHDEHRLCCFKDEFNARLQLYKKGEASWLVAKAGDQSLMKMN